MPQAYERSYYQCKRNLRALVSAENMFENASLYAMFHDMATKRPKSRAAAELGRKRWKGLTAEQRSEIARRAVQARWAKKRKD
jgi:hypothetical protein